MSEIEEAAAAPLRRRHEAPAVVQSAELGLHPVRPDGEIHSMLLKIRLGKAQIKCKPLFFYVQHQRSNYQSYTCIYCMVCIPLPIFP